MNYWVSRDNQRQGPYSLPELEGKLAAGTVRPTDYASTDGMSNWAPVSQVMSAPVRAAGVAAAWTAPAMAPRAGYRPAPPSLHWAAVVVLAMVTFGVFGFVWLIVQARFAKKLDPANKSALLFIGAAALYAFYILTVVVVAFTVARGGEATDLAPAAMVIWMFGTIFMIKGIFDVRSVLLKHYNLVEPINLKLSAVMTLFFNVYYFQYHLTRIANWKSTGQVALPA